ncbi:MAG: tetratricopeptide repeat protein, partial [Phycisphaerae bacterium]
MMLGGLGTHPNPQRGMKYLKVAYHAGSGRAPYILGFYFAKKGNLPEAEKWLNRAVKVGAAPWAQRAEYHLQLCRTTPSKDTAASPKAFFELNRRAAREGDVFAEYATGLLYAEGKGVHPNLAKAIIWLKKSVRSNYLPALRALYQISVSLNISPIYRHEARHAIAAAGSMGWTAADNAVALAFLHAPHPDYQAALRWARIGEGRGNASSDCVLGRLYEAGEGVRKNPKRAFMYYMRAAGLRNRAGTTSAGYM